MQIPETVREHPYAWGIGGGVVVVLLIYWLFRPGTSSGGGSDYLSAYYAAEAQAAVAGNQAQAIATQAATAVNIAKIQADAQKAAIDAGVQIAALQANTINLQTGTAGDVTKTAIAAQQQVASSAIAAQTQLVTQKQMSDFWLHQFDAGSTSPEGLFGRQIAQIPGTNEWITSLGNVIDLSTGSITVPGSIIQH